MARNTLFPGQDTLPRIHALVERFGSDEHKRRLQWMAGEDGPGRSYRPMENALYTQEALGIALEMIGELQAEVTQLRQIVSASFASGASELPKDEA